MKAQQENSSRAVIVRHVIRRGRVTKAEIEDGLGLSHPTVTNTIAALIREGVLRENGEYESTGGRRAKAISAMPMYRHFGGVDITANHVAFVVVNWAGELVARERKRFRFEDSRAYCAALEKAFERFLRQNDIRRDLVRSVGFSLPGILSSDRRTLVRSHALRVENLDLSGLASHFSRFAVDFENDANAADIAECAALQGNSVFLSLSNTVGGAISFGPQMFLGDSRRAGEFGHMVLHPGGRKCYCGKRGCADAYLSALRLSERADGLEDFFLRLEAGEPSVVRVWSAYVADLAVMVSNLRMAFDCEVVVGGYVGNLMESRLAELRRRVSALDLFQDGADYVRLAKCGRESAAIGAALRLREAAIASV